MLQLTPRWPQLRLGCELARAQNERHYPGHPQPIGGEIVKGPDGEPKRRQPNVLRSLHRRRIVKRPMDPLSRVSEW